MKILVLGDLITDCYKFCHATRLCPEAPCPVIVIDTEIATSGGCGLVERQFIELGARVVMIPGSHSYKTRIFAGSYLLCRIDEDATSGVPPEDMSWLEWADIIVVSDYGKGAMTQGLIKQLLTSDKPLFVDAKSSWDRYYGPNTWMFPNEHELPCHWEGEVASEIKERIVRKLGAKGCQLGDLTIPATVTEVVDVTGAGDIFMAGFVYAWTLQLPKEDCLRFANALAGESCRHVGTFVVGREFAQAELDRLRASRESAQRIHFVVDATSKETLQSLRFRRVPAGELDAIESGNLPEGSSADQADQQAFHDSLHCGQIPLKSPSVPIESSGAPLPTDLESSDEQDRRLR